MVTSKQVSLYHEFDAGTVTHIILHVNVGVYGDQVLDDLAVAILTTRVKTAFTQLDTE